MTSGRYGLVLREVGRLLGGGSVASLGAGQLLERFAVDRDGAAFEALVSRHGPMVLGTCRRMLSDPHDVDDAFQATFLVLARKAGSIRDADRLGPWLHGVARRVATRSRALSARRRSRERPGVEEQTIEPPDPLEGFEHRAALDEELARLPEKYRAPLVLCYLEGLTHDEAAEQLRWPVGTVRSRLAGGRDRLRDRLARRGFAPTAAAPAILSRASIPQALLSTTVRIATSAGSAPAYVANLAKGALVAMMWNKLKMVAALGLMAGLTSGGAAALSLQGGDGQAVAGTEVVPKREDDLAKFQGRWKLAKVEPAKGDTFNRSTDVSWIIEGRSLVTMVGGKEVGRSELILGGAEAAKTIDLIKEQVEGPRTTERGLYRLDGDSLEVCIGRPDGPRPAEFKPNDSGPFPALYHFDKQPPKGTTQAEDGKQRSATLAEFEEVNKKIEELKSDRANRLQQLEKINKMISSLEQSQQELIVNPNPSRPAGQGKVEPASQPSNLARPLIASDGSGPPEKSAPPTANPPAPQPIVHTLTNPMMGGSPIFAVVSDERDRVTMIDSATKERATLRMPKGATEVIPIVGAGCVSLLIKGPAEVTRTALYDIQGRRWYEYDLENLATEIHPVMGPTDVGPVGLWIKGPTITRLVVFDQRDKKWTTQDLREPAKGQVSPLVMSTTVTYRIDRFLYIYSAIAKKWSVLEYRGMNSNIHMDGNGRMILPDGNLIHIYDAKTGEWTQIDTKDDGAK
jgi:RNA polymerase sigma factor (sigma-70 family)